MTTPGSTGKALDSDAATIMEISIEVPQEKKRPLRNKRTRRRKQGISSCSVRKPEWTSQLLICVLVTLEKMATRLGQMATVWATTILLGGFITGLPSYDFWIISALTLASAVRLFGMSQEQKINSRSESRRRVLCRWFKYWLLGGPPMFYISGSTVVAGLLDMSMFTLQLSSALVSLLFTLLRLVQHDFVTKDRPGNQSDAMVLYYCMVVIETVLFIPAKFGWELPPDRFFDKRIIFAITHDKERLSTIFDILEGYFVQVKKLARENVALGLDMSLRRHISNMLLEDRIDPAAGILALDVLYQQEEWIKRKQDAVKRARLLPLVLTYIRSTDDHESKEAAISLLTSLMVNKTDGPGPSKFGPLVLLKALDSPENVHLVTTSRSIALPISKYVEKSLGSRSKEEVMLTVQVVRRLPLGFVQKTGIPDVLLELATSNEGVTTGKPRHGVVNIQALALLALTELGLRLPEEEQVRQIVRNFLKNPLKVRELEIVVGLSKAGVLAPGESDMVNISSILGPMNFARSLPEIVEWLSLLDDRALRAQLDKLKHSSKVWLIKYLEQSRGRSRPDVTKLCSLLVRNRFFAEKFKEVSHLNELLEGNSL